MEKIFYVFKNISIVLIFVLAIQYENALGFRKYMMILLFVIFFIINIIEIFVKSKLPITLISFSLKILLIFSMEYLSRYLINYAFHTLYFLVLIDGALYLSLRYYLIIGGFITGISMIKYYNRLSLESNYDIFTQVLFFVVVNIFLYIVLALIKQTINERKRIEILNNKLQEANISIENLTIIKERHRLARDLHDSIGHKMTSIIMQLEMIDIYFNEDRIKAKEIILEAKENARNGLVELRSVVSSLRDDVYEGELRESLEELVSGYNQIFNINVNIEFHGELIDVEPTRKFVIYYFVKESLTNCAKHSQCTQVTVKVHRLTNIIEIIVQDNGVNIKEEITEGNGIKGIRERVENIRGNIEYSSKIQGGFTIMIKIPLLEANND